ncbi:hypothetical protein ACRALDRAFT_2041545 [Sodiomyces alcalophilus JCM 7366]|uniref:uncharacterized protein n=1 Tax=Sodiomyces alcalophilus JCM 7366 TaxID=591952 RepID=UPI0039B4D074
MASSTMIPNTKLKRRFYGPIILGVALKEIFRRDFDRTPNSVPDTHDGAEQGYHQFVYRLAHICDSKQGGSTVTAIAVLEESDCIRYLVGSNERKAEELDEVKDYLTRVLNIVGKPDLSSIDKMMVIVPAVIRFNLPRIKSYVNKLERALSLCIEHCKRDVEAGTEQGAKHLKETLLRLQAMTSFRLNRRLEDDQYVRACQKLVSQIHLISKHSEFQESIVQRAREGRIDISEHWTDLRHFLNRLHAYYQDVETIVRTKRRWVQLFHDFKVTVVPSSKPAPNPLKANPRSKAPSAHDVIGHMTSEPGEISRYRGYAAELQTLGLDEQISTETGKNGFKPIVHAEVLVQSAALSHIQTSDPARGTRFWNNWKYVGSSKPTCRLCGYYFELHPDGVQVRSSHRNLYPSWRLPDAHDEASVRFRDKMLNEIKKKVCDVVFRTLQERVPQGKRRDSNTTSLMAGYLISGDTDAHSAVSDLASRLSGMSVGRVDSEAPRNRKNAPRSVRVREVGEDDENFIVWIRPAGLRM